MAINSYQDEGKTLWKVYVNLRSSENPTIRVQRRVFDLETETAAIATEKKLLKQLTQELLKKEGQGSTWGAVIDRWEQARRLDSEIEGYAPVTIIDYTSCLRKWTKDWLGRTASEINKGDVREVIRQMEADDKFRTYQRKVKNIINLIYEWGIEERLIRGVNESPTDGVQVQTQKEEKPPEILNLDQIKKLLTHAKRLEHQWYPIWAMGLLTGMRNGELFALLWSDVDLENRLIRLTKSYSARFKAVKSTKAGYWRNIPVSGELHQLLLELKLSSGNREHVLPRSSDWNKGGQARILRTFCISIGLPSVRFHTLRACFATQLLAQGIAPAVVMKICGWKDLKTMERYIRLAGIDERGATECLQVLPTDIEVMGKVANLFDYRKENEKNL